MSFRKKSSDDEPAKPEAADIIGSNLSNDAWLAGVERRDLEPAKADGADTEPEAAPDYSATTEMPTDESTAPHEMMTESFDHVGPVDVAEVPVVAQRAPTLQGGPGFPDMGIVYAGLENEGIAAFPSEKPDPVAEVAPAVQLETVAPSIPVNQLVPPAAGASHMSPAVVVQEPPSYEAAPVHEGAPVHDDAPTPAYDAAAVPFSTASVEQVAHQAPPALDPGHFSRIEHGPMGPEAAAPLQTLNLAPGCSWDDVVATRRAVMAALPNTGAPEEVAARQEVNHAYATLRLLRVGPLRG